MQNFLASLSVSVTNDTSNGKLSSKPNDFQLVFQCKSLSVNTPLVINSVFILSSKKLGTVILFLSLLNLILKHLPATNTLQDF